MSASEEETAVETPKEAPKQIDPQEAKAKKEKESMFLRRSPLHMGSVCCL